MSFGAGGPFSLLDTPSGRMLANGQSPAGAPFWADNPDAWDAVYINGTRVPGLCSLTGGIDMRIDSKRIPGMHGATHTYMGNDPARIELTVKLWMPEHLVAWEKLVPILKPRKAQRKAFTLAVAAPQVTSRAGVLTVSITSRGGKAVNEVSAASAGKSESFSYLENLAVQIYHPALAVCGITSVVVVHLGLLEPASEVGAYQAKVLAEEFTKGSQRGAGVATQKADIVKTFGGKTARDLRAQTKPSVTNTGPT